MNARIFCSHFNDVEQYQRLAVCAGEVERDLIDRFEKLKDSDRK